MCGYKCCTVGLSHAPRIRWCTPAVLLPRWSAGRDVRLAFVEDWLRLVDAV